MRKEKDTRSRMESTDEDQERGSFLQMDRRLSAQWKSLDAEVGGPHSVEGSGKTKADDDGDEA